MLFVKSAAADGRLSFGDGSPQGAVELPSASLGEKPKNKKPGTEPGFYRRIT
ncbi:hypothetical protein [Rudaea sp. 3F27F6]|uniref:hypothetical protein n=1 Tax=Rudaea sp. 3F27F6 TaxID=2502208 RepID=UPI001BB18BDF|nr:hypothetical protein [Rudaea sp. 3F27F6]